MEMSHAWKWVMPKTLYYNLKEKDKFEKMKDNLRSDDEKYVSNDTSCKQHIKWWDWIVNIKSLSILWVIFKCNEVINNNLK